MSETPTEAKKVKIGPVKTHLACSLQMPGCKAREMGNVFPIDIPTGSFRTPFAQACTSCMNKMLDTQQWVLSEK